MLTTVSISFSGPALSFLLYENSKCHFQQEGFLLGEVVHIETESITDNDQKQLTVSKTIKINSIMPCPLPHYFYNGIGKVNKEKVFEFLGDQFKRVVAWYKFNNTPITKFTLRDKIIHRQLMNFFHISPEIFTCCLLSKDIGDNSATHTFSQVFMRCNNIGYDKLPIQIPNLSEPNNGYKTSEPVSENFRKIIDDLGIDRRTTQGLVIINRIQNALQTNIDSVVETLAQSEKKLYDLEQEVKQLQILKKLREKNETDCKTTNKESAVVIDLDTPVAHNNSMNTSETTVENNSVVIQEKKISKNTATRGKGKKRIGEPVREVKETRRSIQAEEKEKESE